MIQMTQRYSRRQNYFHIPLTPEVLKMKELSERFVWRCVQGFSNNVLYCLLLFLGVFADYSALVGRSFDLTMARFATVVKESVAL